MLLSAEVKKLLLSRVHNDREGHNLLHITMSG